METILTTENYEGTSKKRPLPSFIKKLWFILTDKASAEHIFWVDSGQTICIPNATSFSQVILPRFFKHSNWQSFVRQLNLYGFRKVYQLNLAYDDTFEKRTVWQFKHEKFRKDRPEQLVEVKRRTPKLLSQQKLLQQQQELANASTAALLQQQHHPQQRYQFSSNLAGDNGFLNPATSSASAAVLMTLQQQNVLQDHVIKEQITELKRKLRSVDKRREDLFRQTIKLSQIQAEQKKVILEQPPSALLKKKKKPCIDFIWVFYHQQKDDSCISRLYYACH
ncbi:HSF-type DNA-binding-domain-containing protein [Mycotypha africana]|uniref:HSF-type DNA-binding-domain-containing protein n=1 Tax=Mycotypha africana TaxID=64632 RepID=UPI0023010C2B|nr:HSF-type DNA-binding-domain-containing protein [Mycotypha africana]KAI8975335.1 HSF-type DNA-binding-domain-containing protein [Mycotypha africana]